MVGLAAVGPAVDGETGLGALVVGPAVEGEKVVGATVVGPAVEGDFVEGKLVIGETVVGADVKGAEEGLLLLEVLGVVVGNQEGSTETGRNAGILVIGKKLGADTNVGRAIGEREGTMEGSAK